MEFHTRHGSPCYYLKFHIIYGIHYNMKFHIIYRIPYKFQICFQKFYKFVEILQICRNFTNLQNFYEFEGFLQVCTNSSNFDKFVKIQRFVKICGGIKNVCPHTYVWGHTLSMPPYLCMEAYITYAPIHMCGGINYTYINIDMWHVMGNM